MRLSGLAILLPLALAAAPAKAADVETLPCIERALGRDVAEGFGAATVADMMATAAETERKPKLDAFTAIFVAKVPLCVSEHGWSDAEAESAIGYTIAKLSLPPIEAAANDKGVDPVRVRRAFYRLPAPVRAEFFTDDDPPATAVTALLETAASEGMDAATEEEGIYIGMLAALYSTLEAERDAFSGN